MTQWAEPAPNWKSLLALHINIFKKNIMYIKYLFYLFMLRSIKASWKFTISKWLLGGKCTLWLMPTFWSYFLQWFSLLNLNNSKVSDYQRHSKFLDATSLGKRLFQACKHMGRREQSSKANRSLWRIYSPKVIPKQHIQLPVILSRRCNMTCSKKNIIIAFIQRSCFM